MSRTISTSIGLLFLFVFVVLFGLTGCEKIVTVTEIERDTVIKNDTLYRPEGPAYVRFISLLPDRNSANITLLRGASPTAAIFGSAEQTMPIDFIPVPSDSGFTLYTSFKVDGVQQLDSINFSALDPTKMYTCALSLINDGGTYRVTPGYSLDTMKVKTPGEGKAYLRLINGLADYPNPNHLNLKLKSFDSASLFASPVNFTKIGNYVEVPTGTYPVMVVSPDETSPLYEQQFVFAQGGYYTAIVVGLKNLGTDKLFILTEN